MLDRRRQLGTPQAGGDGSGYEGRGWTSGKIEGGYADALHIWTLRLDDVEEAFLLLNRLLDSAMCMSLMLLFAGIARREVLH
jgi:hypothetical protein